MDSFFKMVDVQTVLFIYMAVGFFCRKKGIFNDAARDKLTDFVVLITLPCMIFESFHMEFSLESLKQGGVAVLIGQEALEPNPDYNPIRHGIRRFADMTDAERAAAIAENPDYGEIFCRCEKVTKAEILQAIHNPLGVHTVNGIKVRTRATMGRCQGGYCETRITEALHRELGEDFRDIHLGPEGSWMFTGSVKGGEPA